MKPTPLPDLDRRIFETAAQRIERRWHRVMYVVLALFVAGLMTQFFGA